MLSEDTPKDEDFSDFDNLLPLKEGTDGLTFVKDCYSE